MSENTKIEWCDHTFNPWTGCTKISPACDHCYAEGWAKRSGHVGWGVHADRRRTSNGNWRKPLRWNAEADAFMERHDRRQSVFCASLGDWADNAVPNEWRFDLGRLILATPKLDWLLLTKRIGNAACMLREMFPDGVPPNVRIGATICNQPEADRDIPKLLALGLPNLLSMEPLLGPVDLTRIPVSGQGHHEFDPIITANVLKRAAAYPPLPQVHWVIVGGESGPGARPMHPDWARSLRDQCLAAGVPMMFKQWGEWHTSAFSTRTGEAEFRQFGTHQQWVDKASTWVQDGICLDRHGVALCDGGDMQTASDEGRFPVTIMHKVGKKTAGRLLDGKEWSEFPA